MLQRHTPPAWRPWCLVVGIGFAMLTTAFSLPAPEFKLKDGTVINGEIIGQDDAGYTVRDHGKDIRVLFANITEMHFTSTQGPGSAPIPAPPAASPAVPAKPAANRPKPAPADPKLTLEQQLLKLGSTDPDEVATALQVAQDKGTGCHTLLAQMLQNKTKPEELALRLGVIQAFTEINKGTSTSARTLAQAALKDPSSEVRAAAANAIKSLKDRTAIQTLVVEAFDCRKANYKEAAEALKIIDDTTAFQDLIARIPDAVVTESQGYGTKTNTTYSHAPMVPALIIIAGRNLGSSKAVWQAWLDLKMGKVPAAPAEQMGRQRVNLGGGGVPAPPPPPPPAGR